MLCIWIAIIIIFSNVLHSQEIKWKLREDVLSGKEFVYLECQRKSIKECLLNKLKTVDGGKAVMRLRNKEVDGIVEFDLQDDSNLDESIKIKIQSKGREKEFAVKWSNDINSPNMKKEDILKLMNKKYLTKDTAIDPKIYNLIHARCVVLSNDNYELCGQIKANVIKMNKKLEKEDINQILDGIEEMISHIAKSPEESDCTVLCPTSCELNECSNQKRSINALKLSRFMYGVISEPYDNGEFRYLYRKGLPSGFKLTKTYATSSDDYGGDTKRLEECNKRGFRAIRAENGNDIYFAIRGTVPGELNTVISDVNLGVSHLRCAKQLIQDAIEMIQSGKNVTITGHSLGGGLSEAIGLLVNNEIKDIDFLNKNLNVITFNGFGGKDTAKRFLDLEEVKDGNSIRLDDFKIDNAINYYIGNDPVSIIGTHVGSSYRVMSNRQTPVSTIDAHKLDTIDCFLLKADRCSLSSANEKLISKIIAQSKPFIENCNRSSDLARLNGILATEKTANPKKFMGKALTKITSLYHSIGMVVQHIESKYH